MDFVIFLDYRIYEAQEPFLDKFWTFSLEEQGLDAYLVKQYPQTHTDFLEVTLKAQQKWTDTYSKTKPDLQGYSFQKGFIAIDFS